MNSDSQSICPFCHGTVSAERVAAASDINSVLKAIVEKKSELMGKFPSLSEADKAVLEFTEGLILRMCRGVGV